MVDLLLLGRAGQHHDVPALTQFGDQISRPLHRLDLVDQLEVELALGLPDGVTELLLRVLVGQRLDELVTAHADVAVDPPERQHDAVAPECPVPTERVLIISVDESPVDVENRDCHFERHTQPRALRLAWHRRAPVSIRAALMHRG